MTTLTPEVGTSTAVRWDMRILDRPYLGLLLAWGLVMAMLGLTAPYFLTVSNLINIVRDSSILFVVSAGMTVALIAGGLDLSVASTMAVAGIVSGWIHMRGIPVPLALCGGVAAGLVIGVINGLLVTRARINPLIATLATMGLFRGLCFVWTDGRGIPVQDAAFRFARAQPLGIPVPIFFMLVVLLVVYYFLNHTRFGRHVYAVGGNPTAARQAALDVESLRLKVYIISAGLSALAGVVWASVMGIQDPRAAMGRELEVTTAVLLGGATLSGGGGTIQGTLIGVLLISSLANGMIGLGINPEWQYLVRGGLLVAAVVIGQWRTGGYR